MRAIRELSPKEIKVILGADMEGDREEPFNDILPPEKAGEDDLVFLWGSQKVKGKFGGIVIKDNPPEGVETKVLYRVKDPERAFFLLLNHIFMATRRRAKPGIHPLSLVSPTAGVKGAEISAYVIVENNVSIGEGTIIYPFVYLGENVQIGRDCIIFPYVYVGSETIIGDKVTIYPGAVIGSDGFGFIREENGYKKIPQMGKVVIEDDCEIGANTCIDRSTIGETRVKKGTKLDNLIQIGHNVEIGENTVIAAQTGIAGSSRIGSWVMMGGQVGVADHLIIGDGAIITAKSGVTKSAPPGAVFSGQFARERSLFLKANSLFFRLPELYERLRKLEERVGKNDQK